MGLLTQGAVKEPQRVVGIAAVACFLSTQMVFHWYRFVDRIIPKEKGFTGALHKTILEEVCFTPFFNSAYLLGVPLILGRGMSTALGNWVRLMKGTTIANVCVWPALNMVNYAPFLPAHW